MELIEQELMRLKNRKDELSSRIIPDFQHKTEMLYGQIMTLRKESDERVKLEEEYTRLSKELRLRSDEVINIRMEMENLELEQKAKR